MSDKSYSIKVTNKFTAQAIAVVAVNESKWIAMSPSEDEWEFPG